jgi:hypothetical protein
MNDFISFLYKQLPIYDRPRAMFFSSTLLYFLGLRPNNDFDFMLYCKENNVDFYQPFVEFEKEENKKYIETNPKGMFDFLYVNSGNKEIEKPFYLSHCDLWAQEYGATNYNEVRVLGKYHMYYLGIKSTTISMDIIKRRLRARPRAIADLIILKHRFGVFLKIPTPPTVEKIFHKVNNLTKDQKDHLLDRGFKVTRQHSMNEIIEEKPIDMDKFYSTIRWTLYTRYHFKYSIEQIKEEFTHEVETTSSKKLRDFSNLDEQREVANNILKIGLKTKSKSKTKSKTKNIKI